MEGLSTTGNQNKQKKDLDVKKWLEENKLMKSYEMFKKRDVQIEELCEFEDDELTELCKDIGLDTLARKRFVKAIHKLQQELGIKSTNTYNKIS